MNKEIEQKVKQVFVEQLGKSAGDVERGASIRDDLGGDSLDEVEIMLQLEDQFEIEIPDELAEEMKTVGDVVDYICTRMAT